MKIDISLSQQFMEVAATLLMGLALGCLYDIFRLIRQHRGGVFIPVLCDVLFCLFAAAALFVHGMTVGEGELRLYMPFLALCGAILYFFIFGAEFRSIFRKIAGVISKIVRWILKPLKKVAHHIKKYFENLKNIFSRLKKRFTIIANNVQIAAKRKKSKNTLPLEGSQDEVHKIRHTYEDSDFGVDRIRYNQHHIDK